MKLKVIGDPRNRLYPDESSELSEEEKRTRADRQLEFLEEVKEKKP